MESSESCGYGRYVPTGRTRYKEAGMKEHRLIEFRAWDKKEQKYLTPLNFELSRFDIATEIREGHIGFTDNDYERFSIEQYTGLKDGKEKKIFENDIVRIWTDRMPEYQDREQSQYDCKRIEARATIVFSRYTWQLDGDNDFNYDLTKVRGRETEDRRLTFSNDLGSYDFFQNNKWNREHNAHAYWKAIEVIGNVHQNLELLENLG